MIVYFANRNLDILGLAHTNLSRGYYIIDDKKSSNVETGVSTFEFTVSYDDSNRTEIEQFAKEGNYILRHKATSVSKDEKYSIDGSTDLFTILETETDVLAKTINIYAEGAGLDLLNDLAPSFYADNYYTVDYYFNAFISDKGFYIRNNTVPNTNQYVLTWDSSENVISRLNSIASAFECEYQFGIDIRGFKVVGRWVDIFKKIGFNTNELMSINLNVNDIRIKRSMANVATAIYPVGKNNITLDDYQGEIKDEDFYLSGPYLMSKSGLLRWSRPFADSESTGHIYRKFSCDAENQDDLLVEASKELKKRIEPEVNYEVDIAELPEGVNIGDRVNIVDRHGDLYLSSRILKLEESECTGVRTATLGDYIIKTSGISEKVRQLAADFKNIVVPEYDQVDVKLLSTTGTTIHRTSEYVELVATIFYNDEAISDKESLLSIFGENATLTWYRNGEVIESLLDYEQLLEDGFILHITYESYMASSNIYRVELFY